MSAESSPKLKHLPENMSHPTRLKSSGLFAYIVKHIADYMWKDREKDESRK